MNALFFAAALATLPSQVPSVPVDTMIDVGGHRLHFVIHPGTRPVTIVLESGGGATLESWSGIDAQLAARTGATVVAYERAGFGTSDLGPADLVPGRQVDDLVRALDVLAVPPRRILVGHSYGALLALDHVHRHAADVAGVVLVDPMNPGFVEATGDFVQSTVPHIATPANDAERAIKRLVDTFAHARDAAARAEPRIALPVVVISAGEPWWGEDFANVAWRRSHEALVAGWPQRTLVIAEGSAHDVPARRPDTIINAVVELLE